MLYYVTGFPSIFSLNNNQWYMHCILLIHLSVNGYLGRFYFLAILNSAAVNIGVQIPLRDPAFSSLGCIYPEVGFAGSCGSFFSF